MTAALTAIAALVSAIIGLYLYLDSDKKRVVRLHKELDAALKEYNNAEQNRNQAAVESRVNDFHRYDAECLRLSRAISDIRAKLRAIDGKS